MRKKFIIHKFNMQHMSFIFTWFIASVESCRNLGSSGHNSISHPHSQFPIKYNLEDVLVAHYCYRHYNQSCPTCHTHGLLEYSCSFCIENTCEQKTCGNQWGWLNALEECRQTIVITETYNTDLGRLQEKFRSMLSLDGTSKFNMLPKPDLDKLDQDQHMQNNQMKTTLSLNKVGQVLSKAGDKLPSVNLDYRLYCSDPIAELHPATLRCYSQCPQGYNKYGVSCFSNCALPQKDEFSTYCIEPEMRKPIELYSSCAEDCNENNIRDFCFACPEGMHKKDCQCVKSEKIEFREIIERQYSPAILLLIDGDV